MGKPLCFTPVVSFYGRTIGQAIFSSPIVSGRRLDVYHILSHMEGQEVKSFYRLSVGAQPA